MRILVTGGLGYIGLNTCYQLLENNYEIVIIDNLSNSLISNLKLLKYSVPFYPIDIRDISKLRKVFQIYDIDIVIHFASLKSVPESIGDSLSYYDNNVIGTISLLQVMKESNCNKIIFSSSACVYGDNFIPYDENQSISLNKITNPYGRSKYMIEQIIKDACNSYGLECVVLRYFNPVGKIVKDQVLSKMSSNLMDVIVNSIVTNKKIYVYGNDYDTKDGTCIRDFIHMYDLVDGHIKSIKYLMTGDKRIYEIFNLGCGNGISVLQMIQTFEKTNNVKLDYEFTERREGDIPVSISNIEKSKDVLKWESIKTIEDMCKDSF